MVELTKREIHFLILLIKLDLERQQRLIKSVNKPKHPRDVWEEIKYTTRSQEILTTSSTLRVRNELLATHIIKNMW